MIGGTFEITRCKNACATNIIIRDWYRKTIYQLSNISADCADKNTHTMHILDIELLDVKFAGSWPMSHIWSWKVMYTRTCKGILHGWIAVRAEVVNYDVRGEKGTWKGAERVSNLGGAYHSIPWGNKTFLTMVRKYTNGENRRGLPSHLRLCTHKFSAQTFITAKQG